MSLLSNNYECHADPALSTEGAGEPIGAVIARRLSRRDFLQLGALTVAAVAGGLKATPARAAGAAPATQGVNAVPAKAGLGFKSIKPVVASSAKPAVADGHTLSVLLRWGDPILKGAPAFDPQQLTAAAQEKQFGYNCDFVGFFPVEGKSDRGVLGVNHEYTNPELMFKSWKADKTTKDIVDVELAAHGVSLVEIQRDAGGAWKVVLDSKYNRRITATTSMKFDGPAAGSEWLQTKADPKGDTVLGTLNNCAGGKTPWGTLLTAEENFHQYFGSRGEIADEKIAKSHARYGVPVKTSRSERAWEKFYDRFDVSKEPNEAFRHGWVVEIDPFDPNFVPVKHTALGRMRHEGATFALNAKNQVAFYSGDDNRFDYVYKFVSQGAYDSQKSKAENSKLFTRGTLYVAKFNDDGTGEWLPLIQGQGPLTAANGFASQADVLVNVRLAGDALGATKMDRPEDIEWNPAAKKVYMVMTNNSDRGKDGKPGPDAANPRPNNRAGHILEVTEAGDDIAATRFKWEIFMLCGDPAKLDAAQPETEVYFAGFDLNKVSPIACPDNITFDKAGNLWIATDGMPSPLKFNDGLYAVPVAGPQRGELKMFFSGVAGGEVCGPEFTPDETSLFLAIQHPGEGGKFEMPTTRWPDNKNGVPPRPSLIVIQAKNGKAVGS